MEKITRRTTLAGAWVAPAIIATSTIPAYAASPNDRKFDYGLFVTAYGNYESSYQSENFVGYSNSGVGTAGTAARTAPKYFEAVKAGQGPESDLNWDDASGRPLSMARYANGEGSFTPITNSLSGTPGAYNSTSGFWFSRPTSAPGTGSGYSGTTTLLEGAVFKTQVTAQSTNRQLLESMQIMALGTQDNGRRVPNPWWYEDAPVSGSRNDSSEVRSSSVVFSNIAGNWRAEKPVITGPVDGVYTFKGIITYTTTKSRTLFSGTDAKYAQVDFMPSSIQLDANGWRSFELTSWIESASLRYDDGRGNTGVEVITGETQTARVTAP